MNDFLDMALKVVLLLIALVDLFLRVRGAHKKN